MHICMLVWARTWLAKRQDECRSTRTSQSHYQLHFGLIPADEKTTEKVPTMPVQVDDIFGLISNYEKTTKRVPTLPDQILILPSTKSPPLDCGTDE